MDDTHMDDRTKQLDADTEWLIPSPPAAEELSQGGPDGTGRRPLGVAVALVAGGALAGAVAVSMLHGATANRSSANALPAAVQTGVPNGVQNGDPNGQQGFGGGLPNGQQLPDRDGDGDRGAFGGRPGGGLEGEQRLSGTLTAVGASTVTVKTSSGTATYTVTSSTDIVRNGTRASLSDLTSGDQVLVHVYPSASGGSMLVERILVGTAAGGTSTT